MRFLVLGCNGMAGHMVALYLKEQGHDVIGYARREAKYIKSVVGDATDFDALSKVIRNGNFDSIINCVGILNQFAEKDRAGAVLINGYLPHFLAKVTRDMDTQVIQMSTDCVFSGRTGGYTEESFPDGGTFYDRTKAIGELNDRKNVTLRNSIVGPDININGIGLLNWFMKQDGPVQGFKGALWTGQTTLQLAKTMEAAAKERVSGLYNMVPNSNISKYELLKLFNKYIRREKIEIIPRDDFIADKTLIRTNYDGFQYTVPDYEKMVNELGDWMREHKSLYPQYDL